MKQSRFFLFCAASLMLLTFGSVSSAQKKNAPTITVDKSFSSSAPIEVTAVNLKMPENQIRAEKTANPSPLVTVKNISQKSIRFLEVKLEFAYVHGSRRSVSLPFQYGQLKTAILNRDKNLTAVKPQEIVQLTISQNFCSQKADWRPYQQALLTAAKVKVNLSKIIFADDTAWANGAQYRAAPGKQNRWLIAENSLNTVDLNSHLWGGFTKVSLLRAALEESAPQNNCGTYTGFEVLSDCCPDIVVFSDTVNFNQPGNAALVPVTDTCPGGTPSCEFYEVIPCQ